MIKRFAKVDVDEMVNLLNSIGIKTYGTSEHSLGGKLAEATEIEGKPTILVKMETLVMDDIGDKSWQPAILAEVYRLLKMRRWIEPMDIFIPVDHQKVEETEAKAAEFYTYLMLNPDEQEEVVNHLLREGFWEGWDDRGKITSLALEVFDFKESVSIRDFLRC